jgi:hypothetical protein
MLTVEVPLNTMLADLDETLRNLLREELEVHGFEGVDIAFDAPAREWSGQLSKPTVNVFLYDLREAEQLRTSEWSRMHRDGRTFESRPPMVMEASYAVTAWTQAVEDEHRLLSQVLAIFFAYPEIPQARLNGRLANGSQQWPIKARIGQGKGEKSDFWSAVGGQYKVSLDLVIRLSVESGARLERGPEVRTQTIRTSMTDAPPGRTVLEMHRSVGRVKDKKGQPLANVWVTLPDVGTWTASKADGRFHFNRLPPGRHRLLARTADGLEADSHIEVPGAGVDLVIDGKG